MEGVNGGLGGGRGVWWEGGGRFGEGGDGVVLLLGFELYVVVVGWG